MAEDKEKRKSSRHFDLDKPTKRQFNLEKDSDAPEMTVAQAKPATSQTATAKPATGPAPKPKRSFDLNKEPEKPVKPSVQLGSSSDNGQVTASPSSDETKGNGKKWIVAAVIAAALVAGGLLWHNAGKGGTEPHGTAYAAPDSMTGTPADSTAAGNANAESANAADNSDGNRSNGGNAASPSSATSTEGTVHELAIKVWDDAYGTGAERKAKLGTRYREVQAEVNRMYRNGYRPAKQ